MGTTTNYAWEYPDVGADADTWGTIMNAMAEAIDAQVKAVQNLSAYAAPTGAVQDFLLTTAPTGWTVLSGTIGNAASGGTSRANADTEALFTALWNAFSNTVLPIYTDTGAVSTRGASAAADFAANKRLSLTDQPDRFRRSYKAGGSSGVIGVVQGDQIANHTHPFQVNYGSGSSTSTWVQPSTSSIGAAYNGVTSNPSSGAGSETRPTNIAYLTCIKL